MYLDVPRYSSLPGVSTLLDSIGSDKLAARHLDVDLATIEAYRRAEQAPRPVMWALFWISPWGRSRVECDASNDARAAHSRMSMYQVENAKLKEQLASLEAMIADGVGGAANMPLFVYGGR